MKIVIHGKETEVTSDIRIKKNGNIIFKNENNEEIIFNLYKWMASPKSSKELTTNS